MLEFYKYHGAGNDFILIDNRGKKLNFKNKEWIKNLCHRRFGIGADGILMLENEPGYDFKMVFANSDGSTGTMCGNGARCIVHFAYNILKVTKKKKILFLAHDGAHEAEIKGDQVKIQMKDVEEISKRNGLTFLCSGTTPHNVVFVKNLEKYPVFEEGRKIRNSDPNGVNVNFVEMKKGVIHVRTYERGVEDETMACGTGATSVAIATHYLGKYKGNNCVIQMPGGKLLIEFKNTKNGKYQNVYMTGPAKCVFKGVLK